MDIYFNADSKRFELEKNGLMAVAEFEMEPGVMVVTHVIVPPSLRGGGIASALSAEVVAHARREGLKIEPVCSFMQAYLTRHPEAHDLVA
jgi:predicted GNAT family acetyltransferase